MEYQDLRSTDFSFTAVTSKKITDTSFRDEVRREEPNPYRQKEIKKSIGSEIHVDTGLEGKNIPTVIITYSQVGILEYNSFII